MNATAVLADVIAERERQVVDEGWTAEHDDTHNRGELARAAAAYAYEAGGNRQIDVLGQAVSGYFRIGWFLPAIALWPFDRIWWKPKEPRRNLVKAAALIIAEIERLDRVAAGAKVD